MIHGDLAKFEKELDYTFRSSALLEEALTHSSYANERRDGTPHNERLEFLGDSVLNFLVGEMLLKAYPDEREGNLSKMRSLLICTKTLAEQADAIHLGRHLILGRGEKKGGGQRKESLLADAFEAVVAAIYLDGGLRQTRRFITRLFRKQVRAINLHTQSRDYKSRLQETLQGVGCGIPRYQTAGEEGQDHRKTFEIQIWIEGKPYARGRGSSKKEAQQDAARNALNKIAATKKRTGSLPFGRRAAG